MSSIKIEFITLRNEACYSDSKKRDMKKYFSYSIRKLLYDQFFIRKSYARAQTHRKYAFTFDNSKSWNREQKSLTNVPKIRPIIVCLHTDFWNDFREIGSHFCWMCVKIEWISRLFLSLDVTNLFPLLAVQSLRLRTSQKPTNHDDFRPLSVNNGKEIQKC